MIEELGDLVDGYPGASSRTRCFAHIINLIAKSLLKQFDVPKKKTDDALYVEGLEDDNQRLEKELRDLSEGIEFEDFQTRKESKTDLPNDNVDGWVDEITLLEPEEQAQLTK
ncbi:hypothetical protein C0991_008591, partial [Blastosporella zonata]